MSSVSKARVSQIANEALHHIEARQDPRTQTLQRGQVPAPYGVLVDLATQRREVIHTPKLRAQLAAGVEAAHGGEPAGVWKKLGFGRDASPTRQHRAIAAELIAIALVEAPNQAAVAAQVGATRLDR